MFDCLSRALIRGSQTSTSPFRFINSQFVPLLLPLTARNMCVFDGHQYAGRGVQRRFVLYISLVLDLKVGIVC
jgi:hypothetical protein